MRKRSAAIALLLSLCFFAAACESMIVSEPDIVPITKAPDVGGAGDSLVDAGDAARETETLWYYDKERADRYADFAALHPEFSFDEVVWMVDADLDIPPYTDTRVVSAPDDLRVMVSKHFSLPDDYTPSDLVAIGKTQMRKDAADAMQAMIDDAAAEGHKIWAQSGFRSYGVQVGLHDKYSARDGDEAADTYSARAGFSEHQTGLTVDLNTITDAFGDTPEGQWVAENCWKYGYIVRYTKENTDITLYRPEPWHMRYIGADASVVMHDLGILSFEEYWVKYVLYAPEQSSAPEAANQQSSVG